MITKKWQRKTDQWWRGQKVVVIKEIRNHHFSIAPGTICTVERKYNGLHIESEPCPHCGTQVSMSNARYDHFILYDEVVVIEYGKARERMEKEFQSTGQGRCIVEDNGRYLVLPYELASKWNKGTISTRGSF